MTKYKKPNREIKREPNTGSETKNINKQTLMKLDRLSWM